MVAVYTGPVRYREQNHLLTEPNFPKRLFFTALGLCSCFSKNSAHEVIPGLMARHAWPVMKIQLGYSKYSGVDIGSLANAENNLDMVLDKCKSRCALWLKPAASG